MLTSIIENKIETNKVSKINKENIKELYYRTKLKMQKEEYKNISNILNDQESKLIEKEIKDTKKKLKEIKETRNQ